MIEVRIRKLDGVIGWLGQKRNQPEADAWIAQQLADKSWGEPSSYTIEQEDISAQIAAEDAAEAARKADIKEIVQALKAIDFPAMDTLGEVKDAVKIQNRALKHLAKLISND